MAGHDNTVVSDKIVREHAEEYAFFTKFLTVGAISVVLVLLMFLLQFFIGWGYAVFFMVIGMFITVILAMLGKI